MLTFDDCLSYSGLTEDQIDVIARREKITGLMAIALAYNILHTRDGEQTIFESRPRSASGQV